MTLLVRNEADIIEANVAFHLNAGVDFVIATDNDSDDGTTEVLETFARAGQLHLITEPGEISQERQVTRMARLAATEFGANWVINNDADEFWWPRGGSLKDVLAAVPSRFGAVRGMWRHFVPRNGDEAFFAERMTARLCVPVRDRFISYFKTAHRADPDVRVGGGNHEAFGRLLLPLLGWYPIDVLHFPVRSLEQCERKYVRGWKILTAGSEPAPPRYTDAYKAYRHGRMREFYESHVIDEDALTRGLQDGTLAIDTRLRDALRSLQVAGAGRLDFANTEVDQSYLSELGTLADNSALVQAQRRTEALETRLCALETRFQSRLRAKLPVRGSG